ncbi:MAG: glycoside hydrolase family 3 C-terminal domain-containing protein [Bacilli bacterium]|nr:glycoside hydrolase family 3 C-terminal domain-containing protein [Bacilli bacterium]
MGRFRTFGNKTDEVTELEKKNRAIALNAAIEGIVLLENDGVLPLKEGSLALFGSGVRHTVKGGTGSGDVYERYSVSVEQGFEEHGVTITSKAYLDRFDAQYEKEKQEWVDDIERRIKKYHIWEVQKMFDEVINPAHLKFPIGDLIKEDDLTDDPVAVYVIARQAGEAADRKLEKGDFLLDDVEVDNIAKLRKHYEKVVVVINSGSIVDLSPLDEIGVNAVLFLAQAGEEGGNALAKILLGEVSPSGKLPDTWPKRYEDVPFAMEYGILGDVKNQNYKEGLFVGYRYFDSFGVPVRYPFGFGLSYTEFSFRMGEVRNKGPHIDFEVEVSNEGEKRSGKEVVQAYLSRPQDDYPSERSVLVAFAKSKTLSPKEKERLALSFDIRDFAIYDEKRASYVLPKGRYLVSIGDSIAHKEGGFFIEVKEEIVTEICFSISCPNDFEELLLSLPNPSIPEGLKGIQIGKKDIETVVHEYKNSAISTKNPRTAEFLEKMGDLDLINLTVGGGYSGLGYNVTPTVAGRTSITLKKKGIPNINLSDGPAGLRLYPKNGYTKLGIPRYIDSLPENWRWGFLKKFEPFLVTRSRKGIRIFQYLTAFPCALLQAASFNTDLVKEIGKAIAEEMILTGVSVWLAPGMNIHRNPLCGRNFEYYSEDPLLSAKMASSVTLGVQSYPGLSVTIKHFACNNQEDKREYMSTNVKERTLREIYLKGFRLAIQESSPKCLMSSYNSVNYVYMPNNEELCHKVLRNEWGFEGLVMTDWTSTGEGKGKHELCHLSGNDLIEPGNKGVYQYMVDKYKEGKLDMGKIKVSASRVLDLIFDSRVWRID